MNKIIIDLMFFFLAFVVWVITFKIFIFIIECITVNPHKDLMDGIIICGDEFDGRSTYGVEI